MNKIIVILLVLFNQSAFAQELFCQVNVNFSAIQGANRQYFQSLQNALMEFMNSRKWTNDNFLNQERINCSFNIMVEEELSANRYKATCIIQSTRPIFMSNYNAILLNHSDPDWVIEYTEFQPLEYNEASFTTNLIALMSFYTHIILGLDYGSFELDGGNAYFQKAQNVLNMAQNAPERGWRSNEGMQNRYWLINNILNPVYKPVHQAIYQYHRLGLDRMLENQEEARNEAIAALKLIEKANAARPGSFFIRLYMGGKMNEYIGLFSQALPNQKQEIVQMLSQIDPSNGINYQKIITNK